MDISVHTDPFDFIVIENVCDNLELSDIINEVKFFKKFATKDTFIISYDDGVELDFVRNSGTAIGSNQERVSKKTSILIEQVLNNHKQLLNQLSLGKMFNHVVDKLPNLNLFTQLVKHKFFIGYDVLINYYSNKDYYGSHIDTTTATCIFYINPQGKCFKGGELYFPSFNYSFECKHNSMIIFPGFVTHEVKQIITELENHVRISITYFLE